MGCTDLRGVLDGLAALRWPNIDMSGYRCLPGFGRPGRYGFVRRRDGSAHRLGGLGFCRPVFENRKGPVVPNVLRYGDVLQWAALAADRRLTLRNLPPEAGDVNWLAAAFAAAGNPGGLRTEPR